MGTEVIGLQCKVYQLGVRLCLMFAVAVGSEASISYSDLVLSPLFPLHLLETPSILSLCLSTLAVVIHCFYTEAQVYLLGCF